MNITNLVGKNQQALDDGYKVVIHRGGTGSSKTISNLQTIINLAWWMPNEIFSVTAESIPHLDRGAIRDAKKIIRSQGLKLKFNESKRFFTYPNGSILEFFSADREDIAIGARRYLLYGNEVNSFRQSVWDEMARRSRYVFADFNPVTQFWLEDWLEYQPKHITIKSNYFDNPFLPENERERIELRASKDENWKRIHIDCEYGNAEDLVFMPENIIVIDEFPRDLKYIYGMDFGFVAPSVLVKVAVTETDVYIHQEFYRAGMNEQDFMQELNNIDRRDRIMADSEDQRMINYIFSLGYNIFSAKKAAGSVDFGIGYLQGKKINITKESVETIKEFRNLMHAKDRLGKHTGKYVGDDHSVDSVRYACEFITNPYEAKMGGISF